MLNSDLRLLPLALHIKLQYILLNSINSISSYKFAYLYLMKLSNSVFIDKNAPPFPTKYHSYGRLNNSVSKV